jgi:hypothetical protein
MKQDRKIIQNKGELTGPSWLPREFHFGIGGYLGPCHRITMVGDHLEYQQADHAYQYIAPVVMKPTMAEWEQFWHDVEAVKVWNWKPKYWNIGICDGTQWSLKLVYQGRSMHSEGSNAYPGSAGPGYSQASRFGRFLAALKTLTGITELS